MLYIYNKLSQNGLFEYIPLFYWIYSKIQKTLYTSIDSSTGSFVDSVSSCRDFGNSPEYDEIFSCREEAGNMAGISLWIPDTTEICQKSFFKRILKLYLILDSREWLI